MKKFFGDKNFYKSVFVLIIPIMVQQLFVSLAGYIDNIMINSFGGNADAYNGVNAANRIMFVCNFIWLGVASTASIFIAQFFGADKPEKADESLRLGLITSVLFGIISYVAIELFGDRIVDAYIQSEVSRQYGYQYLDYIKHGSIITSVNIMIANAYRSVKLPKIALFSAIIGIVVNVILNYVLIFGHLGFASMGAAGAAIATVISRIVELVINILFLFIPSDAYFRGLFSKLSISKDLFVDFVKRGVPLICNEILWSLGMVLLAMFYTYKNDIWYNAYSYSQNISDLFFIVFSGLGTGTAVFIGSSLGKGDFDTALKDAYHFKGLAIMMGASVGLLMLITAPYVSLLFNPTPEVKELTVGLLRITGIFTAVYCYCSVSFFTLRAGGDSLRAFILDQSPTYIISLPLAIVLGVNARDWGLSIITIYLITHIADIVKIILANYFFGKKKWLVNLTTKNSN